MTSEMAFLGGLQLRAHRFTCQCQDSEDTLVHAAKRFSSAESLQAFDVGCVGGGPVGEELRDTIDVVNIHGECTQIRDDSRGEMRGAYKEALSRISRENVASDCRRRFSSVACSKCLKSK